MSYQKITGANSRKINVDFAIRDSKPGVTQTGRGVRIDGATQTHQWLELDHESQPVCPVVAAGGAKHLYLPQS